MANISLNIYLNFSGNCEKAFTFYHSIFGGPALVFSRFKDMPSEEGGMPPLPAEVQDQILHITYELAEGVMLMGSDCPPAMGEIHFGNNAAVSVQTTDSAEGERIFQALSAGGEVKMPYEKAFWGANFGYCVDRFGVAWMVNCQLDPVS